jgi:hypothetical protein
MEVSQLHFRREVLSLVLLVLWGCGDTTEGVLQDAGAQQTIDVQARLVDEVVVAGGALVFEVLGANAIVPASARVRLAGDIDGRPVEASIGADFEEVGGALEVSVPWEKLSAILEVDRRAQYFGSLGVEIDDLGGSLKGVGQLPDSVIEFHEELSPSVLVPALFEIFPNDQKTFSAGGILRPGEGLTSMLVEGVFEPADASGAVPISATLPIEVGASRSEALVSWPVSVFGIRPGAFTGQVVPVNDHAFAGRLEGAALDVSVSLLLAEIDGFDPPAASRGQVLRALGRGFIPADANFGQSMFFLFDGSF